MGYHFEEGTTLQGRPVRSIIRCLGEVRGFKGKPEPEIVGICMELGLLRQDPCDPEAFLLTDAGNRVRSGVVGSRIPYAEAEAKLYAFMEELCEVYEILAPGEGIIDQGWIFGSMMRKEPTIGDIDLCLHIPNCVMPDPFISIAESIDLRLMPIPCQEIRISRDAGVVRWELMGQPALHPDCTSLDDPPQVESIRTDQGTYRTGTPDEHTVMRTVETVRTMLDHDRRLPDPMIATLRRDLVARYTGHRNADEPAAALLAPLEAWLSDPGDAGALNGLRALMQPEEIDLPAFEM